MRRYVNTGGVQSLFVCLSIYLSVYLPVALSICVCLSAYFVFIIWNLSISFFFMSYIIICLTPLFGTLMINLLNQLIISTIYLHIFVRNIWPEIKQNVKIRLEILIDLWRIYAENLCVKRIIEKSLFFYFERSLQYPPLLSPAIDHKETWCKSFFGGVYLSIRP